MYEFAGWVSFVSSRVQPGIFAVDIIHLVCMFDDECYLWVNLAVSLFLSSQILQLTLFPECDSFFPAGLVDLVQHTKHQLSGSVRSRQAYTCDSSRSILVSVCKLGGCIPCILIMTQVVDARIGEGIVTLAISELQVCQSMNARIARPVGALFV